MSNDDDLNSAWESATDREIQAALYAYPEEYTAAALDAARAVAQQRGLPPLDEAKVLELRRTQGLIRSEEGDGPTGRPFDVLDTPLACCVCQHDRFVERSALLNTRIATFLRLDWLNRGARCLVCARCGYIHWFA